MDNAKKHWPILGELGTDLENKVREFMVVGEKGETLFVATEDGLAYWIGKMLYEYEVYTAVYGYKESTTMTTPTLLNVPDLVSMSQGCFHTLLLNKRGEIYSMGVNTHGQLGLRSVDSDGVVEFYNFPQLIHSPDNFTSVRCGKFHSLALTKDGNVLAWGSNEFGQLGMENSNVLFPFQIFELDHHRVVAIECGRYHSLALTDRGEVYAWGSNKWGQLGVESLSSTNTFTQIPTPIPVQSMAAGSAHTLLLTIAGEVYACGDNEFGQLGVLTTTTRSSSRLSKVKGLDPILQIASHWITNISIALSSEHRCFVWGELHKKTPQSTPRKLPPVFSTAESPLSSYSLHCSTPHSVTIPARECPSETDSPMQTEPCFDSVTQQTLFNPNVDQLAYHWPILSKLGTDLKNRVRSFLVIGKRGEGLIVATEDGLGYWIKSGESKTATNPTPLNVPEIDSMAQGNNYILMLNKRGEIYSMGINNNGQLGLGTMDQESHFPPQLIPSPNKFNSVRCGFYHSLALTEDGKVWTWGCNYYSQVGAPTSTVPFLSPRQITELDHHQVDAVECGGFHSLALTKEGEVYVWGWNNVGQFGDENMSSTNIPTRISTSSPVKSIAAGLCHTLLLTRTEEVFACGYNQFGQLGLDSTTTKSSPRLSKVAGLPPISQIASHPLIHLSIAMSTDHRCFVWGGLAVGTSISTPLEFPPVYSTVESPLSFLSYYRSTPHSIPVSDIRY